jgi:hypothetical protein
MWVLLHLMIARSPGTACEESRYSKRGVQVQHARSPGTAGSTDIKRGKQGLYVGTHPPDDSEESRYSMRGVQVQHERSPGTA